MNNSTAKGRPSRRRQLMVGGAKLALGGLVLAVLCTAGPTMIAYLTGRVTMPFVLVAIVAGGIGAADVGAILLILTGIRQLWNACTMQPSMPAVDHVQLLGGPKEPQ